MNKLIIKYNIVVMKIIAQEGFYSNNIKYTREIKYLWVRGIPQLFKLMGNFLNWQNQIGVIFSSS